MACRGCGDAVSGGQVGAQAPCRARAGPAPPAELDEVHVSGAADGGDEDAWCGQLDDDATLEQVAPRLHGSGLPHDASSFTTGRRCRTLSGISCTATSCSLRSAARAAAKASASGAVIVSVTIDGPSGEVWAGRADVP